jgi:hypothetical protein
MMKLTMDDITPEVENAVNAYLLARAYAETMRESVDKVYAAVLVDIPMFDDIKLGVRYEPISVPMKMRASESMPRLINSSELMERSLPICLRSTARLLWPRTSSMRRNGQSWTPLP